MKETPITPEALIVMGFNSFPYNEFIIRGEPGVPHVSVNFIKTPNGEVIQVECDDGPGFPGCKTMEDLKTLLRLLGHEGKEGEQ